MIEGLSVQLMQSYGADTSVEDPISYPAGSLLEGTTRCPYKPIVHPLGGRLVCNPVLHSSQNWMPSRAMICMDNRTAYQFYETAAIHSMQRIHHVPSER
jgi:hypothetical protein